MCGDKWRCQSGVDKNGAMTVVAVVDTIVVVMTAEAVI